MDWRDALAVSQRLIAGAMDGPVAIRLRQPGMGIAMRLETKRFGVIDVDSESILLFPNGLMGFESHRHWIMLSESDSDCVGWLQSLNDGDLSLAVVSPQSFISKYSLRIHRTHLASLPWAPGDDAVVLVIVSENEGEFTANLQAPVLLNLTRGLGQQVITADEQPVRYAFSRESLPLRRSA